MDPEAIRNPDRTADDVIAGIRVTGSVDSPQVAVFTDPAKSETEALSYLIRGEGLDPSGDSDNTMITSALINLGLSQGSHVFESLGDAVGISGLGFETEGVGDSSQLVVSGYVLPSQSEIRRRDFRFPGDAHAFAIALFREVVRGSSERRRSSA